MHKITSRNSKLCGGSVTRLTGRREYVRVGLTAESDCQGWHECRFCRSKNLPCRRHLSIEPTNPLPTFDEVISCSFLSELLSGNKALAAFLFVLPKIIKIEPVIRRQSTIIFQAVGVVLHNATSRCFPLVSVDPRRVGQVFKPGVVASVIPM